MVEERYYILTTKFADCLNRVLESGQFHHLYHGQPDSGPFLDEIVPLSKERRPPVQFVLFDRVSSSDTFKQLTAVYALEDVFLNAEAGQYRGQEQYTLLLKRVRDLQPPIPFGQDTALWDRLGTTHGKKTTAFYNSGRMLLPLPKDDFEAISHFASEPDALETGAGLEPPDRGAASGVSLAAESELHAYLAENLDLLEPELQPFDPENYVEYSTDDGGRIDLLCRDRDGTIVVVELKKGKGDDVVVGQLARYVGWAKEKLAGGGRVRGLVVANVISDRLRYAAKAIPDFLLISYQVKFELRRIE